MARLNGPTTEKDLRLYNDDDYSDNVFDFEDDMQNLELDCKFNLAKSLLVPLPTFNLKRKFSSAYWQDFNQNFEAGCK